MAGPRVAFLTCEQFATLYSDDLPAAEALRARGVDVVPVPWRTATAASLSRFDAVVMRSTWDWFDHRAEFRQFVTALGQVRAPVFNAPQVLQDFADKRYLARLEAKGVEVVPTRVLESLADVPRALADLPWDEVVLKPAFTANAMGAQRFGRDDVELVCERTEPLPAGEAWLLQRFMPEVVEGELSFVFFDGQFSHAAQKLPKDEDWRVQEVWGGRSVRFEAPEELVAQARAVLAAAVQGTLYARVDGVVVKGRLLLMELEVVEPELFFRYQPAAAERFAQALAARIAS